MTSTKEETSGDPLVQLWSISPRAQQTHPQAQRSRERCADGVEHGHLHSSAVFHLHHLHSLCAGPDHVVFFTGRLTTIASEGAIGRVPQRGEGDVIKKTPKSLHKLYVGPREPYPRGSRCD